MQSKAYRNWQVEKSRIALEYELSSLLAYFAVHTYGKIHDHNLPLKRKIICVIIILQC